MFKGVLQIEIKGHESDLKPYEDRKSSVKVNTLVILKASISLTMGCNSTFCFLHNLRD